MATVSQADVVVLERERRFFFAMAMLLVITSLVGFGYFKLSGISTFSSPWWVHVHAISMVGWLIFFVSQNSLVVHGHIALHRRLGMFGVFYASWIVLVGMVVGWVEVASHRNMPFDPPESIALNWMNVLTFTGLFIAAIRLRQRSDWHKRLMLCAMIILTAPAYGRTLIMFDARTNTTFTLFILAYVAIAALGDIVIHNRIHPAYFWGLGATAFMGTMIGALPHISIFAAFARMVAD